MRSQAGTPRVLGSGRMWPCRTRAVTHAVPHLQGVEEEKKEEVEEGSDESHAQRKLKAFGLRVKGFFLST